MIDFYDDKAYYVHPLKRLTPGANFSKCAGEISEFSLGMFCYCKQCFRYKEVDPSCNKRFCVKCQLKQAFRLFHVYYNSLSRALKGEIEKYRRMIMLTLTGFVVPFNELWKLKKLLKVARNFLKNLKTERVIDGKKVEVPLYEGGIIVGEYTRERDDSYFLHVHALVHGDYYKQAIMQFDWYDALKKGGFEKELIQNSWGREERIVHLMDPMNYKGYQRTPDEALKVALHYVLKYVTKGGWSLREQDVDQVKRVRQISTFGEFYNNMEMAKITYKCKFCDGDLAICRQDLIDAIEKEKWGPPESWKKAVDQEGNEIGDYKEPLELKRAISYDPAGHSARFRQKKKVLVDYLKSQGDKMLKKSFRKAKVLANKVLNDTDQALLGEYGRFVS